MNKQIATSGEASARGTDRTLAIIEYLGGFRMGKSSSEIARALELPVNTVGRITETMTNRGWLYRREDDRRHALTNRVVDLTRPQVNDKSLTLCSWNALRDLRDETGETTQLAVMTDRKCAILEQCVSNQAIKVSGQVGMLFRYTPAPQQIDSGKASGQRIERLFESCDPTQIHQAYPRKPKRSHAGIEGNRIQRVCGGLGRRFGGHSLRGLGHLG